MAVVSERRSSCSRRGTRTAQPLSRKCRLISPTTVGVAYVENSTPRSGSKRSTDLIRPMVATCVRSSSGSPRLRNRRARCSTSGRCIRTSRLRSSAYSTLPSGRARSSMNRARAPLRSCGSCRVLRTVCAFCAPASSCRSCSLIVPPAVTVPPAPDCARGAGEAPVSPREDVVIRRAPSGSRCPSEGASRSSPSAGSLHRDAPAAAEDSSSGCGLACSGMPSTPSARRAGPLGPPSSSAGSSRVPRSSSRTGPSPFLTPARVPRRAVCRG